MDKLFTPFAIGNMKLKNRVVMAPTTTSFATRDGLVTPQLEAFWETRAKGGAGMVIVEAAGVDFPRGMHGAMRLSIDRDITLPGFTNLARAIKSHGARAICQLCHAGRVTKREVPGFQPVAPSPIRLPPGSYKSGETPRELALSEMEEIVSYFVRGAERARKAGFDGVEVHAAHGYLLAQFLSPFCNQRQDRYGGSLENRARLLIDVLKGIREKVGPDFLLWYRINGGESETENGLTLEDAAQVARMTEPLVNAVHVSTFGYGRSNPFLPENSGALLPLCQAIKKAVKVPVIGVGRLNPELADQAIKDGKIDLAAFGREMIADPELPNKARAGKLDDIKPCIACFHCNDICTATGGASACSVNGFMGHELDYQVKPASRPKKIVVVGGGPAGMEAARILALRGHKVTLLEKENRLGGQLNLAMVLPHKRTRIGPLVKFLEDQLSRLAVDVRLNTEADPEKIQQLGPDEVVLAAGGVPAMPPIPGAAPGITVSATDVLGGRAPTGKRVVIVGGGSTGCDTAEFLHTSGKEVTIIEMLPQVANDMGFRDRQRMLLRLEKLPLTILTGTRCCRIQPDGVVAASAQEKEKFIAADTVVISVGVVPRNALFLPIRAKGYDVHMIGDCWRSGKIADASADAARIGCTL